jgi:hypothetical protein
LFFEIESDLERGRRKIWYFVLFRQVTFFIFLSIFEKHPLFCLKSEYYIAAKNRMFQILHRHPGENSSFPFKIRKSRHFPLKKAVLTPNYPLL